MPLLKPRNLNHVLGRLLAAVIAPLLLGTLALLTWQTSQENRLAQTRLLALAHALVQASDAEFDRGIAQLQVLAASPMIDEGDWQQMHRFASEVTRKVPGSLIVLVGPDGQALLNTVVPWGQPLPNLWKLGEQHKEALWEGRSLPLSSGNLSRQAFDTGQPAYSDLYYGVQVNRPALSVSVPVQRDGRSRYALILSYPPAVLQEMIRSSVTVPEVRAGLVDRRGVVVAANGAAAARLGDKAVPITTRPGALHGLYRATSRDGTPLMGAYAVSRKNGFIVRVSQPHPGHLFPTRLTSLAWLALLLTAFVASVVLAGLLSRRLARPLRELGEDVRVGRPPPPERDTGIAEIDLLAQALRDGAQAERQRVQEQTLRTVAQNQEALLRQADRQKDEFLATLAHELRNPLAPIRTSAELIRRRAPADPVVERARSIIERQVLHLSRLVDDLLDVSRITLGRIHLRQEPVNLGEVAAAAVDAVGDAAAQAGLVLEQDIAAPPPFVNGDATRLTQCVVNLLNNAVKFTPRGGRLVVRVMRQGTQAVVEVQDSGVGVSADNLHRIFELFVQERHSGHGGNTGLGIGLALTRRLVELHGGTIRAMSAGLGHGSTFRIELPLAEAPQAAVPPAAPQARGTQEKSAGLQVLVVDDNRDAADTLADLLGMHGYGTAVAHDGQSAVRAVQERAPDAVLLDIGLPDIDGYEVCRRIRTQPGLKRQPVLIAVTGWGQQSDQDAAQAAGFDAHMTKPVAPQALMEVLGERVGR
ncbi:hybrid sensor histidine kinase/response regulator [Ramlibacter tataouinensis]|nr:ATP-binding protein [Ramlibacter tataouinensis]